MTTKTDITLPPLPRHMDSVTAEEFDRRVLAWGRAAVEADRQGRTVPSAAEISGVIREITGHPDIKSGHASLVVKLSFLFARYGQPAASAEPLVRYCPGCGSIGPVPEQYRDCCPDGSDARMIPQSLAEKCRDTFRVAVKVLTAEAEAKFHAQSAAPVAQEPVAVVSQETYNDDGTSDIIVPALPIGTNLYAAPVAAQAQPTMPALTDAMRAVLRNEHCVYDSEDALYAALCDAAQAQRVVNQQMTTAASDVLADTQRAIIEAAERRGYERAIAECAQDLEDTEMLDWLREETCDLRCINQPTGGDDYEVRWIVISHHMAKPHEREIGRSFTDDPRDAIRAARAAKGADHA